MPGANPVLPPSGIITLSPSSSASNPILLSDHENVPVGVSEPHYTGTFTVSGGLAACFNVTMQDATTIFVTAHNGSSGACRGGFSVSDSIGHSNTGYVSVSAMPPPSGIIALSPSSSASQPIVVSNHGHRTVNVSEAYYAGAFTVSGGSTSCFSVTMQDAVTVNIHAHAASNRHCTGSFAVSDSLGHSNTGYVSVVPDFCCAQGLFLRHEYDRLVAVR
jgi:hypothetical protein